MDIRKSYTPNPIHNRTKIDHDGIKSSALILELVGVLGEIDTSHDLAQLNQTTISDNNGGRIEL